MPSRALVVDADILVRAVLGKRLREVFEVPAPHPSPIGKLAPIETIDYTNLRVEPQKFDPPL
jgi:hypothetical protein